MATISSNSYGLCFCILFSCATSEIIHDQRHLLAPIVDTYAPTTDIDNEAILDLDLQLIYVKTLSGTEDSLQEAASVYSNGAKSTISIESMGTSTVNPNLFYAYSGAYDYEDRLMKAALAGDSTDFPNGADTNFDFSVFGKVGRAGMCYLFLPFLYCLRILLCCLTRCCFSRICSIWCAWQRIQPDYYRTSWSQRKMLH